MANYRSFTNRDCEFYPCHKTDRLNCLFCYCPLYFLDCGGNCTLTSRGVKDCSNCLLPHSEKGYDYIVQKLTEAIAERHPDHDAEPCARDDESDMNGEPACPEGTEDEGRPD